MADYDVIALGELLIDFTQNGKSGQGNPLFEANPGGAPCNLLSMLSGLGKKCTFIGKVGNDGFGRFLKATIEECGIDSSYLLMDDEVPTSLALVHNDEKGDRSFSFYRDPGADVMIDESDVPEEAIKRSSIFHCGTVSMTHENNRRATFKGLELAKKNGLLVSFDPNIRPALWKNLEDSYTQAKKALSYCDILKISDDEILELTKEADYDSAVAWIREKYPNITLILVSLGPDGSRAYYKKVDTDSADELRVEVPSYKVDTIETTGAGDVFFGSVLNHIIETGLNNQNEESLKKMLTFANAAAAIITTKKGALRVVPKKSEIEALM